MKCPICEQEFKENETVHYTRRCNYPMWVHQNCEILGSKITINGSGNNAMAVYIDEGKN